MKRRSFLQGLLAGTALVAVPGLCVLGGPISNRSKALGMYDNFYSHVHALVRQTLVQQMIGVDHPETYLDEKSIDRAVNNSMKDFRLPAQPGKPIELIVHVPVQLDSIDMNVKIDFT